MPSSSATANPSHSQLQPVVRRPRLADLPTPPVSVLRELSHARWSGLCTLSLDGGDLHVWLNTGLVAWAERTSQQRSLAHVLCELLGLERQQLVQLAESWRAQGVSLADGMLTRPGMTEQKLRMALQEHLSEALSAVAVSKPCRYKNTLLADGVRYPSQWTFGLEEILRPTGRVSSRRESLADLSHRVYGARWVDLVADGSAAGLGLRDESERGLLEAADQLLLGEQDGIELAVVRGAFGTWAGMRESKTSTRASTWLAFDPEIGLGGAYLGLQSVCPRLDPLRTLPSPPSLRSMPSLFPAAPDAKQSFRSALSSALELGEGALGAHVIERDVVVWGSLSTVTPLSEPFRAAISRACSVLDFAPPAATRDACGAASQLDSFVMLDGSEGFHVGTRVPGSARTFLVMTFAPGSSYGNSIAALSVGASALARKLAEDAR